MGHLATHFLAWGQVRHWVPSQTFLMVIMAIEVFPLTKNLCLKWVYWCILGDWLSKSNLFDLFSCTNPKIRSLSSQIIKKHNPFIPFSDICWIKHLKTFILFSQHVKKLVNPVCLFYFFIFTEDSFHTVFFRRNFEFTGQQKRKQWPNIFTEKNHVIALTGIDRQPTVQQPVNKSDPCRILFVGWWRMFFLARNQFPVITKPLPL